MKNIMKAMICALSITAAAAVVPAMVSARDNKDVYVSDSGVLILRDQASDDGEITLYAEGEGYELHIQDTQNGYGYCYVPYFGATGWVDLSDTYYDRAYDIDGYVLEDNDDYSQTLHSCVEAGFLALRSDPSYDDSNIIAEIYSNGTALCMTGDYSGNYGYCYVPAYGMYGWVDVRYTY